MRTAKPQRGRRARQALALTAAPALVVTLAAPATGGPASSSATPERQGTAQKSRKAPFVSKRVNTSKARTARVQEYWTPERMASAVPAERLTRRALNKKVAKASRELAERQMKPSTGSHPVAPADVDAAAARVRKSKKIGKVFFKTRRGKRMVCSGAAVNSKRKNMVITAGHCVNGGKKRGWHKKWIFVPGYGPGNTARHGIYHAKRLVALRGWVKRSNFNDDVALALVKPGRGTNKKLVRNVGGYGIQFGRSRRRRLAAVGYSVEGRFKGDKQKACRKRTHPKWRGRSIEMRCKRLTGGASGGPWVKGKVKRGRGYVNGVNSNTNRRRRPTKVRSAYFARDVKRMYRRYRK